MAMVTLFLSSSFVYPSHHKLLFFQHLHCWNPLQYPPRKHFTFRICASSAKNPSRSSRKVKSNEELYNDITEFLSAVGLPKSHVPSMKELSQHGRNDLANIVRRRGYKFIRQLLESSVETDFEGFGAEKSLAESSRNSSLGEKVLPNINRQHEKANNITDTISSSADMCIMENSSSSSNFSSSLNSDVHGHASLVSSANKTLEDKVAKFIQNGDLDMIDYNVFGILNESDGNKTERVMELDDAIEIKSRTAGAEDLEYITVTNGAMTLNGSALSSKQIPPSATVDHPLSDDYSGAGLRAADFNNLDFEASGRENQVEINHLKFMLHQKEMDLTRLNEQIEKEKFALSILQTKAETEINKAQNLISDKDAELVAAEESLSGLEEVEIQYSGDGEIVEVAGSFNGWHHRIKMDPQPSSSITDPIGSRKSRRWSTVLWLYPGIYEIKFIVDGQWKIDPQRESVTRGVFCNNILRVYK